MGIEAFYLSIAAIVLLGSLFALIGLAQLLAGLSKWWTESRIRKANAGYDKVVKMKQSWYWLGVKHAHDYQLGSKALLAKRVG